MTTTECIYNHWQAAVNANPQSLVFIRLGDFLETYDEQAKTVSEVLDIVLSSRLVKRDAMMGDTRVLMAGIPYHTAEAHIKKLIDAGFSVGVMEPVTQEATR